MIVKLGGSLITNKSKPFSLRKKVIKNAISEIIESKKKVMIVHGGGSFGHPIAKKYNINFGRDPSVPNQIFGLAKTHSVMTELNKFILDEFIKRQISAISIQPSSIFIDHPEKGIIFNFESVKLSLELGMIPVLYGDIMFSSQSNFSILSGDTIILKICEKTEQLNVSKVVFTMETDGLYIEDQNTGEIELASEVNYHQIDTIQLANLGGKIDITGGIRIKLNNIKEIMKLGIPIQLINGLIENNIERALNNKSVKGTYFIPPNHKSNSF
jgi:isopentenyl phosphate kinase